MSDSNEMPLAPERYCKVTIIIEDSERTVTIEVPKAEDIVFHENAVKQEHLVGSMWPATYHTSLMDLDLRLRANFDEKEQRLYLMTTQTLAVPVEPDSTP